MDCRKQIKQLIATAPFNVAMDRDVTRIMNQLKDKKHNEIVNDELVFTMKKYTHDNLLDKLKSAIFDNNKNIEHFEWATASIVTICRRIDDIMT
eukprot:UN18160